MIKVRDTPDGLEPAARRLLDDLEVRPLSARSLLLSFLLGTHPPQVSAARLVAFGELMGLRPGTVRTALSRMVAAGEAETDAGRYRLTGRLLERQEQQDRGQRRADGPWDGTWWTAIVVAGERSVTERRRFRSAMLGSRLGELRPDLWMRPANLPPPPPRQELVVTRGPLVSGDAAELTARLWDTAAVEATSDRLLHVLEPLGTQVTTASPEQVLPLTFEVSAACVRHLRVEPQLPAELAEMPVSARLREVYADVNTRFRTALDRHLRTDGTRRR